MGELQFCAPCLFGLEGILADELRRLEAADVRPENGRVWFSGPPAMLARANLCLRTAERVGLVLGRFHAETFDQLFEGVAALPLEEWIGRENAFPVKGWSLSSALHSLPDCQAIIKKAAAKRLAGAYRQDWLVETGPAVTIRFFLHKNEATVMLDTSGAGLHKRGYRREGSAAPLKETLAAALVLLARPYEDSVLYDPFCGSGTILIEGALIGCNAAPGLRRRFAAERWGSVDPALFAAERARALAAVRREAPFRCVGADADPAMTALTLANAKKAGTAARLTVQTTPFERFAPGTPRGIVVTNPPYGERLLDRQAAAGLIAQMRRLFPRRPGWRYGVISPEESFEQLFGRPADKTRKLYNGMLECRYYLYYK